ncbi:hypothetical protein LTR86_003752 [Recurvomyces mirabilis]|nr:hypothetical protein LTR86_003752 [Recurvomyces mirabilis]
MATSSSTPPSPLLTLPPELRSHIYYLILTSDTAIDVPSSGRIPESSVLQTCKTIREETKFIFYIANTFRLTVDDNTPHKSHAFLIRTFKGACKAIRKVVIRYQAIDPSTVTQPEHSLQKIHRNLKATRTANPFQLKALEDVKHQIIAYWHGWAGWFCWVIDQIGGHEKLEHEFNADNDRKYPLRVSGPGVRAADVGGLAWGLGEDAVRQL